MVAGLVDENGAPLQQGDFKVSRYDVGTYQVQFNTPFSRLPAVTCTIYGHPWAGFQMSVHAVEIRPEGFVVITSDPNRPQDFGFSFVAAAPV
ncbi:MAG: hypothetical protein H6739_40275 [Alphaproteobacteria bacterium]|nr:hypothetical protein [Alphaproteobacteria bacterium]